MAKKLATSSEGTKGIKETLEALDALELLLRSGLKVAADGKVTASDFNVLVEVATNIQRIFDAVKDADQIPAEIKDIDEAEAAIILSKIFKMLSVFKELKEEKDLAALKRK